MNTKTERPKLNRIKAVLAETGYTGKWLAEQVGKDPVTVSKWCTNTSQPDLYTLNEISKVLKIDARLLLTGQRRNSVAGLSKIDRQTVGFLIRIS